jgi:hypothetical protein
MQGGGGGVLSPSKQPDVRVLLAVSKINAICLRSLS